MSSRKVKAIRLAILGVFSALATLGVAVTSMAQVVPRDFTASPDVYRVRAENAEYRIVEGTWKPGQRDQVHSHPAMLSYWLTDCSLRWHMPDGAVRDITVSAGQSGSQGPVASHAVENMGKSECKIVMFEAK